IAPTLSIKATASRVQRNRKRFHNTRRIPQMLPRRCRCEANSASIACNENQEDWNRMSLQDNQAQFAELKPRLQQVEFAHLKSRLDHAQLERTIAALHQVETLPETK